MKRTLSKKLVINKETIVNFGTDCMNAVKGGTDPLPTATKCDGRPCMTAGQIICTGGCLPTNPIECP